MADDAASPDSNHDVNANSSDEALSTESAFSAFEVEEMAASDELQERRRRTKMALQESTHMDEVSPDEEDLSGIRGLLREADVTPKQIGFCCLGLLVVVVAVIMITFKGTAVKAWVAALGSDFSFELPRLPDFGSWFSSSAQPQEKPENPNVTVVVPPQESVGTYPDFTVYWGMALGEHLPQDSEESELGEALGTQIPTEEFEQQIRDLSRIMQSASTDVNELINKTTDRRLALQDYISELVYLNDLGLRNMEALELQMEGISRAFDQVDADQAEQEAEFFSSLEALDPFATTGHLDRFVGYGQEVLRLKAEYRARQQLLSYYELVLAPIETKIHDIRVNEEALVKGIHVVEVEGSDLNLILEDSGL